METTTTKTNSLHSTCSGTLRDHRGKKNAIYVGQCLSSNLFKATTYTVFGCKSGSQTGSIVVRRLQNYFPIYILELTHFEPPSCSCSSKPHCGSLANSLNVMKNTTVAFNAPLLFPAFHTPDCAIQSPWPACILKYIPIHSTLRTTL